MPFNAGSYQPPPVSDDRSDSPPPDAPQNANQVPIVGLELIVRGLERTSTTSAGAHLARIVQELQQNGQLLPDLHIVSPSTRENLDYVFVSLTGNLRETPRPDVLERVRLVLDAVTGIQARWKMMKGVDKARQVYFVADDRSKMPQLKEKLDNIFRSYHYDIQSSWLSTQTGRITYNFVNPAHIENILRTYPTVDGFTLEPRQPRFVPITYGLEVAVNNVGDYPQARSMIDHYIDAKYGDPLDPAVRSSRLCLNDNIYCAVLKDPNIARCFIADPFDLFVNAPSPPSKPDFLFNLNTLGIPTSPSYRPTAPQDSPFLRQQLQNLQAQNTSVFHTLDTLQSNHNAIVMQMAEQSERHLQCFANILAFTGAQCQLMMAQSEVNALSIVSSTTNVFRALSNDNAQRHVVDQLTNDLRTRENCARSTLRNASANTNALRAQLLPTMPPAANFIGAPPANAQPQTPPGIPIPPVAPPQQIPASSHIQMEDDLEEGEVETATRMQDVQE